MAKLKIHPDYRPLLAAAGLDTFEALFAAGRRGEIDGHKSRSVSRLELAGKDGRTVVYLKRMWGAAATASWRDLARGRWPRIPAAREWQNAMRLARAGVPVSPPVAWGCDHGPDGPRALVAVREVRGPSLAKWLSESSNSGAADKIRSSPEARRAVAAAVGEAVRRLHEAGFSFPDLYAKHIYIETSDGPAPRIVLIDVPRLRRFFP